MFCPKEYLRPSLSPSQRKRAFDLARDLRRENDALSPPEKFRALMVKEWIDAPSLHLEDQSAIVSPHEDSFFVQDRARLRACEGDYLLTAAAPPSEYEDYCEQRLGLGKVVWLTPGADSPRRRLAIRAIRDREVRRRLNRAFRHENLLYVHPYMGHKDVWELALLLRSATRRPVQVLAPPPALTRWVNDKVRFTDCAARLFGEHLVPETHHASNLALLSEQVRKLADIGHSVVIKIPDSAAGAGNVLLNARECAGKPLSEIRDDLGEIFAELPWRGEKHLLVSFWDTAAFSAPSVQIWIPPLDMGDPVVEGLFEQSLEATSYRFVGSRPATMPRFLADEIAARSTLLALVFQHLGYVGRCSFDLILSGEGPRACRIAFIEANGRWGGTSTPMTLVNRLIGEWWRRPYVARTLDVPGLDEVSFGRLVEAFASDLFDVRTGKGRLVLYNPASLEARSALNAIAFAPSPEEAARFLETRVRAKCQDLAPKPQPCSP